MGDDDPASVLIANRVDPPKTRKRVSRIHLVNTRFAFDERAAVADTAQDPVSDD